MSSRRQTGKTPRFPALPRGSRGGVHANRHVRATRSARHWAQRGQRRHPFIIVLRRDNYVRPVLRRCSASAASRVLAVGSVPCGSQIRGPTRVFRTAVFASIRPRGVNSGTRCVLRVVSGSQVRNEFVDDYRTARSTEQYHPLPSFVSGTPSGTPVRSSGSRKRIPRAHCPNIDRFARPNAAIRALACLPFSGLRTK